MHAGRRSVQARGRECNLTGGRFQEIHDSLRLRSLALAALLVGLAPDSRAQDPDDPRFFAEVWRSGPTRPRRARHSGRARSSSQVRQATSCIRGRWNGPFQRLPFADELGVPSRCR